MGPSKLRDAIRIPRQLSETKAAWILLAPLLLFFAVSVIYPVIETIRLSFYDIRGLAPEKFTGFGNYSKLFHDPNFQTSLRVTFIWSFSSTVLSVGLGWGIAMMCALSPRATLPFRVMIFAAYMSAGVCAATTRRSEMLAEQR